MELRQTLQKINQQFLLLCFLLLLQMVSINSLKWLSLASISSVSTVVDTNSPQKACHQIPGLERRQKKVCERHFEVMGSVTQGANLSISECQFQFKYRKWNCSTLDESSIFGNIINKGTREAAYVHAIAAAGVTYSVTKACSKGDIPGCGCDRSMQGHAGTFEWSGCSDNVAFGSAFSKKFTDARERLKTNGKSLMNLHNNEAGRKVVETMVKTECKCHGVSGSCEVKVCWRALSPFRSIGERLRSSYDSATQVKAKKSKVDHRLHLQPVDRKYKPYTETDLVFLRPSPKFCEVNPNKGSLGTEGRECYATSPEESGEASCDIMCCNRGYRTTTETLPMRCNCKFHWCCEVRCEECMVKVERNFCL